MSVEKLSHTLATRLYAEEGPIISKRSAKDSLFIKGSELHSWEVVFAAFETVS